MLMPLSRKSRQSRKKESKVTDIMTQQLLYEGRLQPCLRVNLNNEEILTICL